MTDSLLSLADEATWHAAGYAFEAPYPMVLTSYYAGLIGEASAEDPIARQAVPRAEEQADTGGCVDALGERQHSPVPGLIHVYADRVLVLATHRCAVNCRHCNRRWTRSSVPVGPAAEMLPAWLDYLRDQDGVREVLVTGGDPLTLPLAELERVLEGLRTVAHVGVIRIGSRLPVVAPEQVSAALCAVLAQHHPIYLHTQFNALAECTKEAGAALARLADAGINLGNQSVLLAGVNDDAETLLNLNRWLVEQRCRPYYLFYPERVRGTNHLRPSVRKAIAIGEELAERSSGIALPRLVVDTPDGGGKRPLAASALEHVDGVCGLRDNRGRFVKLDAR